jgi:hypothetical protein
MALSSELALFGVVGLHRTARPCPRELALFCTVRFTTVAGGRLAAVNLELALFGTRRIAGSQRQESFAAHFAGQAPP